MVRYHREEKYSKPKDLREMLLLAIDREDASIGFYEHMAGRRFSEEIKGLITELKNEELSHKAKLENQLKVVYTQNIP